MRLDHLLATDPLGSALGEDRRGRAGRVLEAFGFTRVAGGWQLDDTFPWATVSDRDGLLHVHVAPRPPAHLVDPLHAALDGLVREAGLVRIDLVTRGALEPGEWARRVSAALAEARRG